MMRLVTQKKLALNLILNSIIIAAAIYVFIVTIPQLHWNTPPDINAWIYAISKLYADGINFGRDIIFTYGPFGFLASGSAINLDFLYGITVFKILVHLILFIAFFQRIRTAPNILHGLFFVTAFLAAYSPITLTDYQCVFIFLFLLSWRETDSSYNWRWGLAIALGIVSSFLLLMKFTAGVMTFGALTCIYLGSGLKAWKEKDWNNLALESIFPLIESCLAATISSVLLLSWANRSEASINLLPVAITIGLGFILVLKGDWLREKFAQKFANFRIRNKQIYRRITLQLFLVVLLISLPVSEITNFIDFVDYSLQISSGYSSAMSIAGSNSDLILALVIFGLSILLFAFMGSLESAGFLLALTFIMWIALKHGFVRQDAHIYIFFSTIPILLALALERVGILRHP